LIADSWLCAGWTKSIARKRLKGVKLPNAHLAVVEREKVLNYLLNSQHNYGASKAHFFAQFGFLPEKWELLAQALREHGQKHDIAKVTETGFGPRYLIEGELPTPAGRTPCIFTVWQLDKGQLAPRLITAYPFKS
jgi:hypothetical protein